MENSTVGGKQAIDGLCSAKQVCEAAEGEKKRLRLVLPMEMYAEPKTAEFWVGEVEAASTSTIMKEFLKMKPLPGPHLKRVRKSEDGALTHLLIATVEEFPELEQLIQTINFKDMVKKYFKITLATEVPDMKVNSGS